MPLYVPPGRAGHLWLRERLAVAEHAADLMEEKRRALLDEVGRLTHLAEATGRRWQSACAEAERWRLRAGLTGGERQFTVAAAFASAPSEARIVWRSTMGLAYPWEAECQLADPVDLTGLADSAALVAAAAAHREALAAGVAYGAAQRALDLVRAELDVTTRRQRAIERRWIPRLEARRHQVELQLEEREREDTVRARWARDRLEGGTRP